MVYVSPEKKVLPAAGDNYNYVDEQRAFANSVRDIVSVVNRAEAESISAAMATDGRTITDANPLIVFNNETKNIEIKDSGGWRPMVSTPPMAHVGCTDAFQYINAGVTVNFTSAQILRGGITFNPTTDAIIIPFTGLYRFAFRILASGGSGYTQYAYLRRNTVNTGIYTYMEKPSVADYTNHVTGIMPLTAGDAMTIYIATNNGNAQANTWGTDGYNGTYFEMEMIGV